ncbi:DUF4271 domain-containing protein [Muricauda sp. 2012CJ35-5]|uniref:DUF4271 domain-containing protein n=1 Tax=Flagellimonas spongiicola TaxID=2942208 RepID=A0ABT0PSH4_9FLAO|nr:DUF4271 domain-containing protein [Allomuricauda spongiicola]MCL6273941.1 DUF4271 domain-containing protein [Allomuricauda spongiicola]
MEPIYKHFEYLDWATSLLFFSMLLLALGKYLFQNKFLNFLILPFNNKYVVLHNKKGRLFSWFHIILTVFQLINISLFALTIQKVFFTYTTESQLTQFFIILGLFSAFELLKMLVQLGQGYVFNTESLIAQLIFNKISYLNHSSLVMFISNIILFYIAKDSKVVIITALVLIISINAIGLFKLLKNHQKVIISHFFYFILYLCTLEFAPLVIVGSYLKD